MVNAMKSSLMRARWAAVGAAVAVSLGAGAVMVASAAPVLTTTFTSIIPCRLLDTRSDIIPTSTSKVKNLGIRNGAVKDKSFGNGPENDIVVIFDNTAKKSGDTFSLLYDAGSSDARPIMGNCDAEFADQKEFDTNPSGGSYTAANPTALLLNVTTVGSTANGFVTVYPWQTLNGTASDRPFFSSLNPVSSLPSVSNNVTVGLTTISTNPLTIANVKCGSGSYSTSNCTGLKAFRVFNENGNTHVIIDVLGYYL